MDTSTGRLADSFVAIDFETADQGRDSACSVALITVEGVHIADRTAYLIRPPRREFAFTHLHGISWDDVADKPSFPELWPELLERLTRVEFVAAHNASFDRSVLMACCNTHDLVPPPVSFLCTVELAKAAWALSPANLPAVCEFLGIPLHHHHAESDAEACARIVIAAKLKGIPLASLLRVADAPKLDPQALGAVPDHPSQSSMMERLDRLADLRSGRDTLAAERQALIDQVLTSELKARLAAIDEDFSIRSQAVDADIDALEAELRSDVLRHGVTVKGTRLHAVLNRGRVSWDTKSLDKYCELHPELLEFRKQGEAFISFRPANCKSRDVT